MIYGNPLIFGGSGGPSSSDAILTVTVPAGSTVTATKGGVTLTPTMWVQAADNTLDCALFVIGPSLFDAQNAWTVTATLSGDTASDTVTIDSNEQYSIMISYHVPSGYQEVEYIEATGTQWLNFGISVPVNFKAKFVACQLDTSYGFFVIHSSSGGYGYRVYINKTSSNYYELYSNASSDTVYPTVFSTPSTLGQMETFEYEQNANGQQLTAFGQTLTRNYTPSSRDLLSFFRYYSNSSIIGKGRLKHIECYNDGVLSLDAWACYRKTDSVVGMWDKVSQSLIINAGSGTFAVGPDV